MALKLNHPDARGLLRRVTVCPQPTDASGNASYTFAYDGSDQLTTITKTQDSVTYSRTVTWVGGNMTAISAWTIT